MLFVANYKNPPPGGRLRQNNILLLMKLTIFLTLVACLQAGAKGLAQKVTLNENKTSLEKVLKKIGTQTGYTFLYEDKILEKAAPITLKVHEMPLEQALKLCFDGQPLNYKIFDLTIVIKEKPVGPLPKKEEEMVPPANIVRGMVSGSKGESLAGISVTVKGTAGGTSTDGNGSYAIDVPRNGTLIFSYVGYATREIPVNGRSEIDVIMEQSNSSLDQVVVVGYGTQKRKDLTGSVASVTSKDIGDLSVTRADQALMGKAAGVQVKAVSGQPGAAPQIRVRGVGSISAGTDPLYVVDGFPTDNIQTISPGDIESIDILKDASATAIYGSRGANGVVIINTKRGKSGATMSSFEVSYGLQSVTRIPQLLNAKQLAQYAVDGLRNKNLDNGLDVSGDPGTWTYPVQPIPLAILAGTDKTDNQMVKQLLRTAPVSQYIGSASGGNDKIRYALSGEYLNQEGIVKGSDFRRYSLRANLDAKLSNRLTVKASLNPSYTQSNLTDESTSASYNAYISESPINRAQLWPTYFPARTANGDYFQYASAAASPAWNPLAWVENVINRQKGMRLLGNINAEYKITDDLSFNVLLGATLYNSKAMRFEPSLVALGGDGDGVPNIATGTDNSFTDVNWLSEYTLNYKKSFGKHNISALAGYTTQKDHIESNFLTSNRYPNNLVPTLSAVSGIITDGSSDIAEWSLISYLVRANYNYNSKYYITASYRTDGSSRFGSEKKYGAFPSVALAWRISDEPFLKQLVFLNELKLRASYGETGNNNIGNYKQYATINYNRYVLGNGTVTGFSPAQLDNPLLTWEKQKAFNEGIDISLFGRRLNVTVDYFKSRNTDLLLNVNIPAITGFYNSLKNIGEVQNTGLEFTVSTVNVKGKDFQWSTDLNLSTYRNKVNKLGPGGDPIYSASNVTKVGQPIGMFYGFLTNGVYMNQAEIDKGPIFGAGTSVRSHPGDVKYVDFNNDGKIDNSDMTVMGNPYPKFYYGMTNRLSYKNFSFSGVLQGSRGNQILNMSAVGQQNTRANRVSQLAIQANYWKSEADPGDGRSPRPNDAVTGNNRAISQRYLDNGSFLRITNMTLAYMLPEKLLTGLKLSSLRIYANATNAVTFTKNKVSFNPDVSNSNNALNPGVDFNDYPLPKTFLVGVNIGF
jgi:TonB-linked SusC/RagA family outer membrane protein